MPRQNQRDPRAWHYTGGYDVVCIDACGRVRWRESPRNALLDQGEYDMLDHWFRGAAAPTFCGGLLTSSQAAIPADTATLADIIANELTGTGYARIGFARDSTDWPSIALDNGDYRCQSKYATLTNSGGTSWPALRWLFLCSVASGSSGRLYSVAQLRYDRTVPAGNSLMLSYWGKLS